MTCPICEQDLEIVEKSIDSLDDNSTNVKFAICRDCRKQWKLKDSTGPSTPKRQSQSSSDPPKRATSNKGKSQDRPVRAGSTSSENRHSKVNSAKSSSRPGHSKGEMAKRQERKPSRPKPEDAVKELKRRVEVEEEETGWFKPIRIILAVLSVLTFLYLLYQGFYITYFDYVIGQAELSVAIVTIALGAVYLVSGVFIFSTLKNTTILPFIVPSMLYLLGGVIAFLFRGDSIVLLTGSIISLIVSIFLVILVLIQKLKTED
jgi:hypothetical protein